MYQGSTMRPKGVLAAPQEECMMLLHSPSMALKMKVNVLCIKEASFYDIPLMGRGGTEMQEILNS